MLVARRFLLTGRVQGVGFRFFAESAARQEGLRGWVRNQPDGSVEVFAEGDDESLARFEGKIRRGPPGARLEQVKVVDDVPTGRAGEFTIRQ
jgi:acylphosphatase